MLSEQGGEGGGGGGGFVRAGLLDGGCGSDGEGPPATLSSWSRSSGSTLPVRSSPASISGR